MNSFVRLEITQQMMNCRNFLSSVRRAALKDDGVIDKKEERLIRQLEKATRRYVKELGRISGK
ncbi:MAG: hypothetical protein J5898_03805 [Lachnospiraceae bacterium]|nr:hypothetical protein [Lachnospiraceae bacterium]